MISQDKLCDLIVRAHGCACRHGFHDVKYSPVHMFMLVLGEVGEAVEADRRNLHSNLRGFEICKGLTYNDRFKNYVKDSLEDELADIAIRLFDMCGELDIVPSWIEVKDWDAMRKEFVSLCGDYDFCERCYLLSCLLCRADDGDDVCLDEVIGSSLSFLFFLADDMGIDLLKHIEIKMAYNESRPIRHGKRY